MFYNSDYHNRANHVLECEFYLLENLDCCLIAYQPYRPLINFVQDLAPDNDQLLSLGWKIINDSLRTDLCLLYPPYIIALGKNPSTFPVVKLVYLLIVSQSGALHIACIQTNKESAKQWFAELNVDLGSVLDVVSCVLNLYELWKNFDEKEEIPPILQKMPKPKVQNPK